MNDEKISNEPNPSPPIQSDNEQGMENMHDYKSPTYNNGDGNKSHIDKLMQNLNKKQRRTLIREYERQGNNCCLHINALYCPSNLLNTHYFHLIRLKLSFSQLQVTK